MTWIDIQDPEPAGFASGNANVGVGPVGPPALDLTEIGGGTIEPTGHAWLFLTRHKRKHRNALISVGTSGVRKRSRVQRDQRRDRKNRGRHNTSSFIRTPAFTNDH